MPTGYIHGSNLLMLIGGASTDAGEPCRVHEKSLHPPVGRQGIGVGQRAPPCQAEATYVDSCTFDRQNRRVTVRARTAQAGWQGQIVGSVQTFAVPVDTFENYVYKYNVTNNAGYDIRVATSGDSDIIVNGQQVPRVVTLSHGQTATVYSNIMEFRTGADNHGAGFEANFSNTYDPLALSFKSQDRLSRTTEGYLMIEKLVTVSRPR